MAFCFRSAARLAPVLATLSVATACTSIGLDEPKTSGGSTLSNLLRYGSTTEPPIAAQPVFEAANCPQVLVIDGRSSVRSGTSQVSIANVARECIERADGSIAVKVGVEGRALLGPGGRSGRIDVPVVYVLRRGDKVLTSRTRRVAVAIPPGQTQSAFTAIEGDLVVPKGTGDFDIFIGLGGSAPAEGGTAGRRRGAG